MAAAEVWEADRGKAVAAEEVNMHSKIESGIMEISLPEKELKDLKSWFAKYVMSFQHADPEIQQNITLKEDHTHRVCKAIVEIGVALGLHHDALRLAEAIALLHDIGRFEQFTRYRTFMDMRFKSHAADMRKKEGTHDRSRGCGKRLCFRRLPFSM